MNSLEAPQTLVRTIHVIVSSEIDLNDLISVRTAYVCNRNGEDSVSENRFTIGECAVA